MDRYVNALLDASRKKIKRRATITIKATLPLPNLDYSCREGDILSLSF